MTSIKLLVTDLDNTLYDWVSSFVPSFYAMVDKAVDIMGADREKLLDELRDVHRVHGNSEQPFALLETPTVERFLPDTSRAQKLQRLDEAFHAFNSVRKDKLRLYPGVLDALETIRKAGCLVVAHTEARVPNVLSRLQRLGVSEHLQAVYAPIGRGPGHPSPERSEVHAPSYLLHPLPADTRKPDPHVLTKIFEDYECEPRDALYVGDSLTKDISMARAARAHSAFAAYGRAFDPNLWKQLVRVTHWTDADVAREEQLRREFASVKADVVLDSFGHLLTLFDFRGGLRRLIHL